MMTDSVRRWLWFRVAMVMIIALLSVAGAHAQEEPPVEPTATSTPTEAPLPPPTETPVPTPTQTPLPLPTETPLPEPTATLTPTPGPTAIPTSTPSPSPTASPTPTPTSAPVRSTSSASAVCVLSGSATVGFPNYAVFNCTPARTSGQVFVSFTAPSSGWQYRVAGITGVLDTPRTGLFTVDSQNVERFQVYLGPESASLRGCGSVTVATWAPSVAPQQSVLNARTPDVGTGPCSGPVIQPVTASVVGGVLPPVGFSHQPRVVPGSLMIRVNNPSRTTGWTLDVSATDFVYTGAAPGQANLPASSLTVQRPGQPALPLSNSAQPLVRDGGAETVYEFPMQVTIPGGAAAGSYSSTITLTTTNAPGR